MKHRNSEMSSNAIRSIAWGAIAAIIAMLMTCAHQKPQVTVSQYRFILNDESYRIRSIQSTEKSNSYNEVIGDRFLAVDYDQDGVLESVVLGDVSLNEAQKVYDYGLNSLFQANKLRVREPDYSRYVQEKDHLQFEIRSFRPSHEAPFNQFRITNVRTLVPAEVLVFIDYNADGVLDEVLKGEASLEQYQSRYQEMIQIGLEHGELVKLNGLILVKEK
ncbi:MAG: hypothetical protein ONB31_05155 [candidate division KSB1 bacterium]|nr:hypothetical protein [candidate division KSB1 bacterium]MDZ7333861.1 hypothetical protein [candidate division KSB1 bacterium]MDZ7399107.1 hypothetical protein [candidate division KSB1 bacterium]